MNLDLGASLLNGLAVVDPADIDVARFLVYALLGSDYDKSPYTQNGERIARLAASGIRLVIEEFRSDVTKTRKDGSRGRLRIDYGDPRQPEKAVAWLWRFIDGAKSAGQLYGRALVVSAAEQHACRLVLQASQRTHPTHWGSHKDLARKELAAPHLPASLKALETAVAKAHSAYQQAEKTATRSAAAGRGQVRKRDASQDTAAASEDTEVSEEVESVDGQELAA